jgi:hypothetical protein
MTDQKVITKMTPATSLLILQDREVGDTYMAANDLAAYMVTLGVDAQGEALTDWLAEGDYDGSETVESLISEWKGD